MNDSDSAPPVGIVMGSRSDWATMRMAAEHLDKLEISHEARVVSAHRTPDLLAEILLYQLAQAHLHHVLHCLVFECAA